MSSIRIAEFDTWRAGYGLAVVRVLRAGTNTLADVFSDEDLTAAAANPITLTERMFDSVSYGRFAAPYYVGAPYELQINSVDRTGVTRPGITTLDDEDASLALVTVSDGEEAISLADHLARRIDVENYGLFIPVGGVGASAATNNATLEEALGVAGDRGAAFVDLPAGTFAVTNFIIPTGVTIRGQGRVATTLQSTQAGQVAVIGGDRAGLSRLTLDGVTLVTNSVGVYAENKNQIVLDDVEIKRFEIGIHRKGGTGCNWRELYVSNNANGYKGHGDSATGNGGPLEFDQWNGGKVELNSVVGIELRNVDQQCDHQVFRGIGFDTNTGAALSVVGTRAIVFEECWWNGNTANIGVNDGSPVTADNTVLGFDVFGGSINGGTIQLTGTLESVAFHRVTLQSVNIGLTTPGHNVLAEECREVSGVQFSGTATAWLRRKVGDGGSSSGLTTGNAATKAWGIELAPGQVVYLEAKVIGRQQNGTDRGWYHIATNGQRPGEVVGYDTQTADFVLGEIITGATSHAVGRIIAQEDDGATGTVTLQDVTGTFIDNEIITTPSGSATVNGSPSFGDCTIGSVTAIRTATEINTNWNATFVANGPEIELHVTGDTAETVEWTVSVDVVST